MNRKQIAREIDFVDNVMQSHFNDYGEETHRALQEAIKLVEQEPKTVSIPEGATNGDVFTIMFNKTFPKTIVMYKNDESRLTINPMFSREWWEMPYKEG